MSISAFTPPEQQELPQITNAKYPFDNPDADVILRSADNVDFRTFKFLLSMASPFFQSIFILPSPSGESSMDETRGGVRVVPLVEKSSTVEKLLKFCYPIYATEVCLENIDEAFCILDAADKYRMEGVEARVRKELLAPTLVTQDPVRLFAIVVRRGFEEEARIVARHTLRIPLAGRQYLPEFEDITAGNLHRLQEFHVKCGAIASKAAQDFLQWSCKQTPAMGDRVGCCHTCRVYGLEVGCTLYGIWRPWGHLIAEAVLVLTERPCSSVINTELIGKAAKKACKCSNCWIDFFEHATEASRLLAAHIDNTIAEIPLEITFKRD